MFYVCSDIFFPGIKEAARSVTVGAKTRARVGWTRDPRQGRSLCRKKKKKKSRFALAVDCGTSAGCTTGSLSLSRPRIPTHSPHRSDHRWRHETNETKSCTGIHLREAKTIIITADWRRLTWPKPPKTKHPKCVVVVAAWMLHRRKTPPAGRLGRPGP